MQNVYSNQIDQVIFEMNVMNSTINVHDKFDQETKFFIMLGKYINSVTSTPSSEKVEFFTP